MLTPLVAKALNLLYIRGKEAHLGCGLLAGSQTRAPRPKGEVELRQRAKREKDMRQ